MCGVKNARVFCTHRMWLRKRLGVDALLDSIQASSCKGKQTSKEVQGGSPDSLWQRSKQPWKWCALVLVKEIADQRPPQMGGGERRAFQTNVRILRRESINFKHLPSPWEIESNLRQWQSSKNFPVPAHLLSFLSYYLGREESKTQLARWR